jgi:hypothetical protein
VHARQDEVVLLIIHNELSKLVVPLRSRGYLRYQRRAAAKLEVT